MQFQNIWLRERKRGNLCVWFWFLFLLLDACCLCIDRKNTTACMIQLVFNRPVLCTQFIHKNSLSRSFVRLTTSTRVTHTRTHPFNFLHSFIYTRSTQIKWINVNIFIRYRKEKLIKWAWREKIFFWMF